MKWFRELFQYDFISEPIQSTSKLLFVGFILAPVVVGFIWKEYDRKNIAGKGGAIFRRATDAVVEETRPDVRQYVNSNREFEIQPARRNQP